MEASLAVAGLDSTRILEMAGLGVAGVNMPSLAKTAHFGIAASFGTTMRKAVLPVIHQETQMPSSSTYRAADKSRISRAVYLLDFAYLVCTDRELGFRWRQGFEEFFEPDKRAMPLILDSAGFRRFTGTAPGWVSEEAYWAAIEITRPDMFMAYDIIGNMQESLAGYERFRSVYGSKCIPVWQMPAVWDKRLDAVNNARWAAKNDPVLRYMCEQSKLVAIGGMVRGPMPDGTRHLYLHELCKAFPDNHFWALGMARDTVVNGLGQLDLLDRVWLDGSYWIHNARNDRLPYVHDGLIKNLDLGGASAKLRAERKEDKIYSFSFFTLAELMIANLRALHSAYLGLIEFPRPITMPVDPRDHDQIKAMKQLMLW